MPPSPNDRSKRSRPSPGPGKRRPGGRPSGTPRAAGQSSPKPRAGGKPTGRRGAGSRPSGRPSTGGKPAGKPGTGGKRPISGAPRARDASAGGRPSRPTGTGARSSGAKRPTRDERVERPRRPTTPKDQPRPTAIRWKDLGPVGTRPPREPREQKQLTRRANLLPVIESEYGDRIRALVGAQRAPRITRRLAEAAGHFEDGRYPDAERMLTELMRDLSDLRVAVEMLALSRYRLGKWLKAADALERARVLGAGFINHPVLADCYRALGRHARVEQLWLELSEASPRPDVVAEGRIVMASSLADRGDLAAAIRLMRPRMRQPRVVEERHLREWYVLADLLDRSGETGSARRIFERIARFDREFSDVRLRLAALGAS